MEELPQIFLSLSSHVSRATWARSGSFWVLTSVSLLGCYDIPCNHGVEQMPQEVWGLSLWVILEPIWPASSKRVSGEWISPAGQFSISFGVPGNKGKTLKSDTTRTTHPLPTFGLSHVCGPCVNSHPCSDQPQMPPSVFSNWRWWGWLHLVHPSLVHSIKLPYPFLRFCTAYQSCRWPQLSPLKASKIIAPQCQKVLPINVLMISCLMDMLTSYYPR